MSEQSGFTARDFVPSGKEPVDEIKELGDRLARAIDQHCAIDGPLKQKAILDAQSASMFGVKALFSKDGRR